MMTPSVFDVMFAPLVECLILVGIHSYLGLHVIRRRVIFVDLALAQVAALGTTVGFIFGIAGDSPESLLYSLVFCLIAAGIFAFTRVKNDRVPQEAVIGLAYAITAAAAILVVQKTNGIEHMEDILVGGLLWVDWADIAPAAIAYSIVGVVHWVFRKQFLRISDDPDGAYAAGMNVRLWDFLFYATFGFVITFSVHVAGVLLVFVFLVAPAILAVMMTKNLRAQLLIGWGVGTLVTVVGMFLSWKADLSTGPTVVAFYGVVLALAALGFYVVRSKQRVRALGVAVGVVAVMALVVTGLVQLGRALGEQDEDGHSVTAHAHALPEAVEQAPAVKLEAEPGEDPFECWERVEKQVEVDVSAGLPQLVQFLAREDVPPFCREQGLALLKKHAGQDFGYDVEREDNAKAVSAMKNWLQQRGAAPAASGETGQQGV